MENKTSVLLHNYPPPDINEIDSIDVCSETEDELGRSSKRLRKSSSEAEEGWTVAEKKKRRGSNSSNKEDRLEVYISSKDRLPKQFALARMLKDYKITKISFIKYVNPYKVRLQFENEAAAKNLLDCEDLINKGWKLQKAMELSVCYGIIRDVDLEITDEVIAQNITCPPPAKILSLKRLHRRNRDEGGWCPCETVRLCFEGNQLPQFVRVCDISIKVSPFVHQVSQCSMCWKLGHTRKMCPGKVVICPKCGGRHENCDSTSFSCVNCGQNHISLSKTCPAYKKERRLREIMAEFGCTYRKALECYVPPENLNTPQIPLAPDYNTAFPHLKQNSSGLNASPIINTKISKEISYAEAAQKDTNRISTVREKHRQSGKCNTGASKKKSRSAQDDWIFWDSDTDNKEDHVPRSDDNQEKKHPPFRELLSRLKEILFLQQVSFSSKLVSAMHLCLEWFMLVSKSYISDWSVVKTLFSFITQSP